MIHLLLSTLLVLTPAEKRGRQLYLQGESAAGRAVMAMVAGATELPASSLPCGSCHGPDGRGVPEGTIAPADVRGSVLALRYDDARLRGAIASGIDAAGNPLSPVMPRYRMHDDDLSDLLAYLRRLGDRAQPGLTASEITVATTVRGPVGEMTRAVIAAYFDDINRAGGIFGRALRLAEDANPESVFALICASPSEVDPNERVPLVTPFPSAPASPSSFFLYADLEAQALALARAVGDRARHVEVLDDGTPAARAAADAVKRHAWQQGDRDVLFLLGRVSADEARRRLAAMESPPRVLVAGGTWADNAGEVLVAAPSMPSDVTPEGLRELESFAIRHQLSPKQLPAQIATYAALKVFVEGLKRSGRELTREKLIASLEQLYQFPTGLTPPVSFSRNRHVGAETVHVVPVRR